MMIRTNKPFNNYKGFTLIELAIVLIISGIGVLFIDAIYCALPLLLPYFSVGFGGKYYYILQIEFFKYLKKCMKTLLIVLGIIVFSCNNISPNAASPDSMDLKNDTVKKVTDTISKRKAVTINNTEINDSVIYIKFAKDSISTTVTAELKGINHPVTVYIPIKQGKQLMAALTAKDSVANIRFNQIFTPDGKADGPFGKELKRAIHQQGTYKLIIAEDLMQGDEYKGKFKLTVVVK